MFLAFKNNSVSFDSNGWADALEFKPISYDLCVLLTSSEKSFSGWWTGYEWEFGARSIKAKVVKWKKNDHTKYK